MKSNIIKPQTVKPDLQCEELRDLIHSTSIEANEDKALSDLSNVSSDAIVQKISDKVLPIYQASFKHKQCYKDEKIPMRSIDTVFIVPYDSVIDKVAMYNMVAGMGGATELDVKMSTGAGFVSIFDVTPKIQASVGDDAFVLTGHGKRGLIAPVVKESLILKEGTALRVDMLAKQSGAPADCGLTLFLRKL